MSDLRAAAQQALEACTDAVSGWQSLAPLVVRRAAEESLDALRIALAEPVQEPVAWVSKRALARIKDFDSTIYANGGFDDAVPLYTAPPQRKPLTEETMRECAQAMDAEPLAEGWYELIKFARAIERAHGIGGQP